MGEDVENEVIAEAEDEEKTALVAGENAIGAAMAVEQEESESKNEPISMIYRDSTKMKERDKDRRSSCDRTVDPDTAKMQYSCVFK